MGKLTQIYTLGDHLGIELNDGTVVSFKYGEHENGLFDMLMKLSQELGRAPSFEEVLEYPKLPHPNTFAFYFGSFEKAREKVEDRLRFLRYKMEQEAKREEVVEMEKRGNNWTRERIIQTIIRMETELGHFPKQKEISIEPELPSYPTVIKRFGNLEELKRAVEEAKTGKVQNEVSEAAERIMEILESEDEATPGIASEDEARTEIDTGEMTREKGGEDETEVTVETVGEGEKGLEDDREDCVDEQQEREKSPVQTTVEVKDSETGKTMKIVITLEIFFPK